MGPSKLCAGRWKWSATWKGICHHMCCGESPGNWSRQVEKIGKETSGLSNADETQRYAYRAAQPRRSRGRGWSNITFYCQVKCVLQSKLSPSLKQIAQRASLRCGGLKENQSTKSSHGIKITQFHRSLRKLTGENIAALQVRPLFLEKLSCPDYIIQFCCLFR